MPIDDSAPDGFKQTAPGEFLAGPKVKPPQKCRTCGKMYVAWLPHECPSERVREFQQKPSIRRL